MHISTCYKRSPQQIIAFQQSLHFMQLCGEEGGAVSRKVNDSQRSRIAEESRERTNERERERERERGGENNVPAGKRKTERSRTAGKEKRGCCLARSFAGASIDAFARAFMNEFPYSGGSSPLSACATVPRVRHRPCVRVCPTWKPRLESLFSRRMMFWLGIRNRLRNTLVLK